MRKFLIYIVLAGCLFNNQQPAAQVVTRDEAAVIANKYIRKAIDRYGDWGGDTTVSTKPTMDLRLNGKLIGYYCNIEPDGFAVMSLRKEFSPVKACSDKGIFNPEDQGGLVALIKSRMAAHIKAVEDKFGPVETATTQQVESVLTFSCREAWDQLAAYIPGTMTELPVLPGTLNENVILLSSEWHQHPPYNNECPYYGCTDPPNGLALVGCVATAGAQIMKYWCWPPSTYMNPSDPYEWSDMRNDVATSDPIAQQNAVAELNHDVGVQVDMDYGCTSSGAYTADMEGVFEQNSYNSICGIVERSGNSEGVWWSLIKGQINANQPIQYRIEGHSIVCDGWRNDYNISTWEYHMNYGWQYSGTAWYPFDQLPDSDPQTEFMVLNILPNGALGQTLSGGYLAGYRYVNMNASGSSAIFFGGNFIQTLPNKSVTGTGTTSSVKFYGTSSANTRIYTNGNHTVGIKVANGGMILMNNGSLKLKQPSE